MPIDETYRSYRIQISRYTRSAGQTMARITAPGQRRGAERAATYGEDEAEALAEAKAVIDRAVSQGVSLGEAEDQLWEEHRRQHLAQSDAYEEIIPDVRGDPRVRSAGSILFHMGEWLDWRFYLPDARRLPSNTLRAVERWGRCHFCEARFQDGLQPCRCGRNGLEVDGRWYYCVDVPRSPAAPEVDAAIHDAHLLLNRRGQQAANNARRAQRLAELGEGRGHHTPSDLDEIWQIQRGRCYFCKAALGQVFEDRKYTIDHLIPVAEGGDEWPANLVLVCRDCNTAKSTRSEAAYWRKLSKLLGKETVDAFRADVRRIKREIRQVDRRRRQAPERPGSKD